MFKINKNNMITNYSLNTCKYRIDKLEKVVYLMSKDSIGEISPNEYVVIGGASATRIICNSISLNETTSLDERYQFSHSLSFQVDGYRNDTSISDMFYVVVKDKNGSYYLVNPQFKMKMTYTYTLDSIGEHTDFTLSTISNFPLMLIENFAPWADSVSPYTEPYTEYKWVNIEPIAPDRTTYICDVGENDFTCKDYSYCPIDKIKLNLASQSTYCDGEIMCSNNGYVDIDHIKNSASFTESFDGENIAHEIKFSIPYDNMTWHNFLLDFNGNKYSAVIVSKCGKYIACGFDIGFMPSYSLQGSSSEDDKIEITLQEINNGFRMVYENEEIPIITPNS